MMDAQTTDHRAGTGWLWLSAPLAALCTVAAASGILFAGTYERDAENFATQAKAQDVVTLFVVVPLLIVLWRLAVQGSLPARLLWHGAVFYLAYTYAIASFMVRFSSLFLVYTSILGCSTFAILGSVSSLNQSIQPGLFDTDRWPRRAVTGLLLAIVAVFSMLWLADIVPALLDRTEPASLAESGTPTNGVEVLDLALFLPGAATAAYWVWRREARGFVMATGLLAFVVLLGLALVAMVIGQYTADLIPTPAPAALFVLLVSAAIWLLKQAVDATARNDKPEEPAQRSGRTSGEPINQRGKSPVEAGRPNK